MDALAAGLTTIFNGVRTVVDGSLSPVTIAVLVLGAAMAWLGAVDIEELNRRGTKPRVGRH
jgi:hypothetical protein